MFRYKLYQKINMITFNYSLDSVVLERKVIIKDLGIFFDSQLSFRPHYDYISKKGLQLLGFVTRNTRHFKRPNTFLTLYYSLVRSILEYGSAVWSPFYEVHIQTIERVQKRCLKIMTYKFGYGRTLSSYSERLKTFNVVPLETRRKEQDLLYLHKILHCRLDTPCLLESININTNYRYRQNKPFKLNVYKNNTSYYNPIVRMCRLYNDISAEDPSDLDVFQSSFCKYKRLVKTSIK